MNKWVGRKGDDFIVKVGTPEKEAKLSSGGRSMKFEFDANCDIFIVTDKEDTIKSWTSDGHCVSE
jgi:hypothetical protein